MEMLPLTTEAFEYELDEDGYTLWLDRRAQIMAFEAGLLIESDDGFIAPLTEGGMILAVRLLQSLDLALLTAMDLGEPFRLTLEHERMRLEILTDRTGLENSWDSYVPTLHMYGGDRQDHTFRGMITADTVQIDVLISEEPITGVPRS
ncbi:MAG TPA: hypothetical protein PLD54_00570 [Candidatus Levybacteria bacterium]|nr:hypothetical protein [Candidatus Levybacteria bacterium]